MVWLIVSEYEYQGYNWYAMWHMQLAQNFWKIGASLGIVQDNVGILPNMTYSHCINYIG